MNCLASWRADEVDFSAWHDYRSLEKESRFLMPGRTDLPGLQALWASSVGALFECRRAQGSIHSRRSIYSACFVIFSSTPTHASVTNNDDPP